MSEASEFLVFLSALRDTPSRLAEVEPIPSATWKELIRGEAVARARLEVLMDEDKTGELPEDADPPNGWATDPTSTFQTLRSRVLELLDGVSGATLHRSKRLRSGKALDPWRLAGELAQRDVSVLARLRSR